MSSTFLFDYFRPPRESGVWTYAVTPLPCGEKYQTSAQQGDHAAFQNVELPFLTQRCFCAKQTVNFGCYKESLLTHSFLQGSFGPQIIYFN